MNGEADTENKVTEERNTDVWKMAEVCQKLSGEKRKKKNVAVIFGGCSPEYGVSLESASAVIANIDREKYQPVLVGITREGSWYFYGGPVDAIRNDAWHQEKYCIPAVISPSRKQGGLLICDGDGMMRIPLDLAFPVLHGQNGEDGSVQGLCSMAGISLAGCGILASALCMDKDRAHRMVQTIGVRTPRSLVFAKTEWEQMQEACGAFVRAVGFPIFVKPVKAGSSYGITKVNEADRLEQAVKEAFGYDDEVILEEYIDGFEVGCAVLGKEELRTGEVDEIELSQGFFDFTEKYTLKTSAIHVPARITQKKAEKIKETAKRIYRCLGCEGFARVDLFLTFNGELVFNEVNTIPGFTEHSRYPGMMRAAGMSFPQVIEEILKEAQK